MNLTSKQKSLADKFLTTKTQAKVRRRKTNADGSFEFYTITRDTSPIDFPVNDEEFAIKVHDQNPSAPLSPIYVNLRSLPQELINEIAAVLAEVELKEPVDACCGIPKTALAFAKAYSDITQVPYVDIFEKVEDKSGREIKPKQNAEKGNGKKLLVIDDVISHGNSKIEALKAAEALGYTISSILVLIDRGQGGVEKMREAGYNIESAFTIMDLLTYYVSEGKLSQEKFDSIASYFKK